MNFTHHKLKYSTSGRFFLFAGPCVVENEETSFKIAEKLVKISDKFQLPLVFKGSYKKANRSKLGSFSGIGDIEALEILQRIGAAYQLPVLTDIHSVEDVELAANYVDVLQIPAFLCRQTDLLVAAAKSGKWVNIKKGQFLSPSSMKFAVDKVRLSGNENVLLTDRGTMFGYNDLIVDFTGIPIMKENHVPVIMDVTHSLQKPNQLSGVSGGRPEMIETIAKAAIAVGADGLFLETHPEPEKALSDGENMLNINHLEGLIEKLVQLDDLVRKF